MQTAHRQACDTGLLNTDIAPPAGLQPRVEQLLSSVELRRFFEVSAPPEWVDDAPMSLPSQGRVRVKVIAVRRLAFSPVGDEFGADDD